MVTLPPRGFAWAGSCDKLGSTTRDELAWVDAADDGRTAEIESNGAADDTGDEVASGEGFLRFFGV